MSTFYVGYYKSIHSETNTAYENILENKASILSDEIVHIKSGIDRMAVVNWEDSAKTKFEEVQSEISSSLDTLITGIDYFSQAQEVYSKLKIQLDELQKSDEAYTTHVNNEPQIKYETVDQNGIGYTRPTFESQNAHDTWDTIRQQLYDKCSNMRASVDKYLEVLEEINGLEVGESLTKLSGCPAVIEYDTIMTEIFGSLGQVFEELYQDGYYGANQGQPYYDYMYGNGEAYVEIIRNYFPDMSDEEIADYVKAANYVGCGYAAVANWVFQGYQGREDEYERDFGFPMYIEDANGNTIPSVNLLFMDVYCYTNKEGLVDGDNILNFFPRIFSNGEEYSYEGSSGRNTGTISKNLIDMAESERYRNSGIKINTLEARENRPITRMLPYGDSDIRNYDSVIKESLSEGNIIGFAASDYNLYPADENNNPTGAEPYVMIDAGHWMTITDINVNGDYVISTWGGKYILDASSVDKSFGLYEIEFTRNNGD